MHNEMNTSFNFFYYFNFHLEHKDYILQTSFNLKNWEVKKIIVPNVKFIKVILLNFEHLDLYSNGSHWVEGLWVLFKIFFQPNKDTSRMLAWKH